MGRDKISDVLLSIAAETADGCIEIVNGFLDPFGSLKGKYDRDTTFSEIASSKSLKNAAYRLKKNGCLEKIEKKGKVFYKITEKGRSKIMRGLFDKETWDGKWRVVIFDVPEERKNLRNVLRKTLRLSGFKLLQKSVWISPFDVLDDVEKLADMHNLHDNLWYFISNSIKDDETIIEMFLKEEDKQAS